ncbi:MAG: flagellar biosynthesis protein FliQ [Clostridiales bacterium]|nr:flagellar biosynthesis protein FliQ [Clostridiales bacterium]
MDQSVILGILSEAIRVMLMVAAPILGIAMAVGAVIALVQATTQINEQTMVFAPKVLAVFTGLLILGAWMLTQLGEYVRRLFDNMLELL